jgi:hypothetical protein
MVLGMPPGQKDSGAWGSSPLASAPSNHEIMSNYNRPVSLFPGVVMCFLLFASGDSYSLTWAWRMPLERYGTLLALRILGAAGGTLFA